MLLVAAVSGAVTFLVTLFIMTRNMNNRMLLVEGVNIAIKSAETNKLMNMFFLDG